MADAADSKSALLKTHHKQNQALTTIGYSCLHAGLHYLGITPSSSIKPPRASAFSAHCSVRRL